MPEKSKVKVRRKRSPAAAAFDSLTTGALAVLSMIVVVVVVSLGPQASMHQLATSLSTWTNGHP